MLSLRDIETSLDAAENAGRRGWSVWWVLIVGLAAWLLLEL